MNTEKLTRLQQSVQWSFDRLRTFRSRRLDVLRQYVGYNYSDDGSTDRVPVNFLELSINVYLQHLIGSTPKAFVNTPYIPAKPATAKFEYTLNDSIEKMHLGDVFQDVVLDAMVSFGIIKLGLKKHKNIQFNGSSFIATTPFADHVPLDDWVHDMTARSIHQCKYYGNRFRMDYDEAMELFKHSKDRDRLQPGGEITTDEKAQDLSKGQVTTEEYKKTLEVWELWLPDENLIITVPADREFTVTDPLSQVEWDGPDTGPYKFLSFAKVPGNTMPLPPAAVWMDLHLIANRLYNKLGRQADRQKTMLGVRSSGLKDGERTVDANDGEAIVLDDPQNVGEYTIKGPDQINLAFLLQTKDLLNLFAGNPELIGGLGPQAETLGQEQLLSVNASKRVQTMQQKTIAFVRDVITDIGYYIWTDPISVNRIIREVPGTDIQVTDVFSPKDRAGNFYDRFIEVDPYSMQYISPEQKLAKIQLILERVIGPLMPIMQAQGVTLTVEPLIKMIARYSNLPELNEIVTYMQQAYPESGSPEQRQSPVTRRINERVSRPGVTRAGRDNAVIRQLLGGKLQPSEQAAAQRNVG